MCTVSYLPLGNSEFILTSNRDERITRSIAEAPEIHHVKEQLLLYPKDPLRGGTWIACSESGRVICLLNGAYIKYIPKPSYRKSRGLVLLDAFDSDNSENFILTYDFEGIEPFTLIFIDSNELQELRWDGEKIHSKKLNKEAPHIWASATLYSEEIINKRKAWFTSWLSSQKSFLMTDIIDFHHFGGEGDKENDLIMNRENYMLTVSITSIHHSASFDEMIYKDLLSKTQTVKRIARKQ